MVKTDTLQKVARAADEQADSVPSYHDTLLDVAHDMRSALFSAQSLVRRGSVQGIAERDASSPQDAAEAIRGFATTEFVRFATPDLLERLAGDGAAALDGLDRSHPLLKRGKMNFSDMSQAGLPLQDGSVYQLAPDTRDELADISFRSETGLRHRAQFILPADVISALGQGREEERLAELSPDQKPRYLQAGYEINLALSYLKEHAPVAFESLIASSEVLARIRDDKLKPYLTGLSREFQEYFVVAQKDLAWSWRNQLEPGKADRPAPDLGLKSTLFRNQMGLGALEYLLPAGKATLEYLRYYGTELSQAPYRRTEIKQEHFQEFLTGVPLQNGKQLAAAPDVLVHLAREHHELWRFSREVSWQLPDTALHQPQGNTAHIPWKDLPVETKNRDILNIFGVAYMLGSFSESEFNELARAAAPGNPNKFQFVAAEQV